MADSKKPSAKKPSKRKKGWSTRSTKNTRLKGKNATTTGKVRGVKADQINWRTKLQDGRIKFDDEQKAIYLVEMRAHGLKGRSAEAAGVTNTCVQKHRKNDPEFDEGVDEAIEFYRGYIAAEVRRRGAEGWEEPMFFKGVRMIEPVMDEKGVPVMDDKGKPVFKFATITRFSDRLLELEAKRIDPTYRDKTTIDLQGTGGGVLLAPAGMTPEEAVARNEELNAAGRKVHSERVAATVKGAKKGG